VTLPESTRKYICDFEEACRKRVTKTREQKKIVLTNGCFDLLHAGHIHALEEASKLGDELWVALNSDSSVKTLKGPSRPIYSEYEHAYMISSLRFVSLVFIFETTELSNQILRLKPDLYAKSGDYSLENLNKFEKNALMNVGAEICFIPFLKGFSTSSKIETIQNLGQ